MLASSPFTPPESRKINTWQSASNTVKVENVVAREDSPEIVALFNALVGRVKSSRYMQNAFGNHLEVEFYDHDSAMWVDIVADVVAFDDLIAHILPCRKAPCMSGYLIHGAKLKVSPISSPLSPRLKRLADDRRNLYVLGLPFSLTKTEFATLFSQCGTVVHSVILATVDNSSRRRGFIVFSTHEEAKLAMCSLSCTQLKGHCLDISWAVVQRSGGFLDGGDRGLPLDSTMRSNSVSFLPVLPQEKQEDGSDNSSAASSSTNDIELSSLTASFTPTPTLLVTNLPWLLFSQAHDMHPLFYPFGRIKKLNLVEASMDETTSVIVEYESAAAAQEAKETLHGQVYLGNEIMINYVRHKSALFDHASASKAPFCNTTAFASDVAYQHMLESAPQHCGLNQGPRFKTLEYSGFRAPHPSGSFNLRSRHALGASSVNPR
ncbi:hypothetical protein H0H92_015805 [Tricholoma furcatifolium]|nr:hypothetical protein H0H92_015805 [Tricholoma furcatifolium]